MRATPSRRDFFRLMSQPFLAAVAVAGLLISAPSHPAIGANKADVSGGNWQVKVDPPARKVEWPESLNVSIEQPSRQEHVLFPSNESEFVVVGLDAYDSNEAALYNLATGKKVGGISGSPVKSNKRAVSADGKYLACAKLDGMSTNELEVWSLETGKRLCGFKADDTGLSMLMLDFAAPGELLTYTFGQVAGKFVYHLRIWDAQTGKAIRQLDLDKHMSGGDRHSDISPGGHYLAAYVGSEVLFYDLQTAQIKGKIKPREKTDDGDNVHAESVRFSPDGKELAVYCRGSKTELIEVFDVATGESKLKHEIPQAVRNAMPHPASYKGPPVEFVAQPAGFLFYGAGFLERETGLLVWSYKQGILEHAHSKRLLTPAGFIASMGTTSNYRIQSIPFPAEKLEKTLEAYRNADTPALVKAGVKVKLNVKVSGVRFGKPEETQKSIEAALTDRLATDGLEVDDEGTSILTVDYKESAGQTLKEFTGGNRIFGGGTATGRSAQSTQGDVSIKWTSKDGKTKIYEETFKLDPSYLSVRADEKLTAETVREKVFSILKLQLAGLPRPYFVPEDKSLTNLPLASTSLGAGKVGAQDSNKKKIEARKNLTRKPK
ncbi:MAG: WD40 repeat domain-containing protein [Planctomycetaceae bacterium]|nr:WD40 repeat domain-containing protein [Planctomycetaceae bacterium]